MTAQCTAHETIEMPTQEERMERSSWMSDAGLRSGPRAERLSGETAVSIETEKERAWTTVLASAAATLMCALAGFVLMAAWGCTLSLGPACAAGSAVSTVFETVRALLVLASAVLVYSGLRLLRSS
jgi:hypothetical protein